MKSRIIRFILSVAAAALLTAFLISFTPQESPGRIMQMLGGVFPQGLVQGFTYLLFIFGLSEVLYVSGLISKERDALSARLLPEAGEGLLSGADVGTLVSNMHRIGGAGRFFLADLIRKCCVKYSLSGSPSEALSLLDGELQALRSRMESRTAYIRYVCWAVPSVGFIGTVIGISAALGRAGQAATQEGMDYITRMLYLAFDTTLVALVLVIVLNLFLHVIEKRQEELLSDTGSYLRDNLIYRLPEDAPAEENLSLPQNVSPVKEMTQKEVAALAGAPSVRKYRTALIVFPIIAACCVAFGISAMKKCDRDARRNSSEMALRAEYGMLCSKRDSVLSNLKSDRGFFLSTAQGVRSSFDSLASLFDKSSLKLAPVSLVSGAAWHGPEDSLLAGVYFISADYLNIKLPDGRAGRVTCSSEGFPAWTGTGVLLQDGTFVTSRKVAEPWYWWTDGTEKDEAMAVLNAVQNAGGSVTAHLSALSCSGSLFGFYGSQLTIDRTYDQYGVTGGGQILSLAGSGTCGCAYMHTELTSGGLEYSGGGFSPEADCGLTAVGFRAEPSGNAFDAEPEAAEGTVISRWTCDGRIMTGKSGFCGAPAGSPVFVRDSDGGLELVGILPGDDGIGLVSPVTACIR